MRDHRIVVKKPFLADGTLNLIKFGLLSVSTEYGMLVGVLGLHKLGGAQTPMRHAIFFLAKISSRDLRSPVGMSARFSLQLEFYLSTKKTLYRRRPLAGDVSL